MIRELVVPEAFQNKITISLCKDGCWNWCKSTREEYGQLMVDGVPWTAHRYSYNHFHGAIPKGMVVRHTCDNRRCCNPRHLIIGTYKDNWVDSEKVHRRNMKKLMKRCFLGGKSYPSLRAALKATSIPRKTFYKYCEDGVFNVKAYRESCFARGIEPKL